MWQSPLVKISINDQLLSLAFALESMIFAQFQSSSAQLLNPKTSVSPSASLTPVT